MAKSQKQGGKKGRKYGRNRAKCEKYAHEHRRTRNNPARTMRAGERTPGSHRSPVPRSPSQSTRSVMDKAPRR